MLRLINDNDRKKQIMNLYSSLYQTYLAESKCLSFFGSQPISMMKESILHVTEKRQCDNEFIYNLTAKLDGTRMLLFFHPLLDGNVVFIDRSLNLFEPILPYTYTRNYVCLFDGEMYEHVFFVFDMLYYNGFLCEYMFETRLRTLQELLISNRDSFTDKVISCFTEHTKIHIVPKLYMELKGFHTCIDNLYNFVMKYFSEYPLFQKIGLIFPLKFDGLIFTPRFTRYILADNWKYPGNILYKWKPVEHETIDFLLEQRLVKKTSTSKRSSRLIVGLVRGPNNNTAFLTDFSTNKYAVVKCSKDTIITSTNIYECAYCSNLKTFYVIRKREDKNYPNTLRTAKMIWKLIIDPININCIVPIILGCNYDCIDIPRWQSIACEMQSIIPFSDTVYNRFNKQNCKKGIYQEFEIRIGHNKKTYFDTNISHRHYKWLSLTLEHMNISYSCMEIIDVFDDQNLRTSYNGNSIQCILKHRQDSKDFNFHDIFGYDFRLSVSTEEAHVGLNDDFENLVNQSSNVIKKKKRRSYNFSPNFQIDMTEYTLSKAPNKTNFQVEIELKQFHYFAPLDELNNVIVFVLRNLYGRSELL